MIKDLKIITLGTILRILILLSIPRIMTSIFSPSQMGDYYLLIAFMSLASLFIINPIGLYINRNVIVWKIEKTLTRRLKSISLKIFPATILIFSLIFYLVNQNFNLSKGFQIDIFLAMSLALILKSNNETYGSCVNILNNRKTYIFSQTLTPFLTLIFFLGLNNILPLKINNWFFSIAISNGIIFLYLIFYFNNLNFSKEFVWVKKSVFRFSSPLVISNLLMWFVFEGYRFLLEPNLSEIEFGLFVVGYGLSAQIVSSLDSIYNQFVSPYITNWMTNKKKIQRHKKIDDYVVFTITLYTLGLFTILTFSSFIFDTLIDTKFSNGKIFFEAGLFFEYFKSITNQIKTIGYSENNNNYTFLGYFFGSISIIALIYLKSYSIQHILFVSSLCVFIVMLIFMNKLIKTPRVYFFVLCVISLYVINYFFKNQNKIFYELFFLILTALIGYVSNIKLLNRFAK